VTPEQLTALMARATRPRRTVPIVLDGDLRQRIEELAYEYEALDQAAEASKADRRLGSKAKPVARLAEIEAELDSLEAQAAEVTVQLVVEGLPGTPFTALKAEHPPREGNKGDAAWGLNLATARDPLIRATLVGRRYGDEVVPLADDFADWLIGWATDWQLDKVLLAALSTSRGDDAAPLPRRRSATQTSDAE
jgi:hypothetical protein